MAETREPSTVGLHEGDLWGRAYDKRTSTTCILGAVQHSLLNIGRDSSGAGHTVFGGHWSWWWVWNLLGPVIDHSQEEITGWKEEHEGEYERVGCC